MATQAPDAYLFKRDHRSSARLNLLHGLYTRLSGYLLHPFIPRPKGNAAVADIGTGTTIWPVELSDELPESVTIDGFDINGAQFPHEVFRPSNLHFYEQDCFKPFPSEFLGKYDVIALRFMVTLVDKSNLKPLIQNLSALLKPGGHIQWIEPDNTICKPIAPPGVDHPAVSRMCSVIRKPSADAEVDWVHTLEGALSQQGFEDVTTTHHAITAKMRPFFRQIHLLTFEDVRAGNARHAEEFGEAAAAVAEIKAEFDKGVTIDWAFQCVVGRKSN